MRRIVYVAILMALASCNQDKSNKAIVDNVTNDFVTAASNRTENDTTGQIQTQAEMNEAYYNGYVAYKDFVEGEFQKLLEALPKHRKELLKEKSVWEMYLKAAQEVSRYEDNGSCTPLHVVDVLAQATQIRSVPQHSLFCYVQGKDFPHSKTTFNPAMIADAYSTYIKVVEEDEFIEQKTKYQESLLKEQRCWDDLVKCRNEISQLLNGDLKKVYEIGTNQMLGTKLYQMKSQNYALKR